MNKIPLVAIVGRVNVGKSTLFNRIIGKPLALVDERPGLTRDRLRKRVDWEGLSFEIMDTGGLFSPDEDQLSEYLRRNIEKGVEEADLVIFLVDLKKGITPYDMEIAEWLRKKGKKVILAANKADVKVKDALEFTALGFGEPVAISSAHGIGVPELLDRVVEELRRQGYRSAPEDVKTDKTRVSILGRPNVGKSSLLNALVGEEVALTSPIPGTTRDSVDVETEDLMIIDTAGIKRKYKDEIEYYAHIRSRRSLRYAEVGIVVIDATDEITRLDKKIINLVIEEGRGLVVAINKIDLLDKERRRELLPYVSGELAFVYFAPKVFTSARTGEGIELLREMAKKVRDEGYKKIQEGDLLSALEEAANRLAPPTEIYSFKQVASKPPTFKIVSRREIPAHYLRFLERFLREKFDFLGNPILFRQVRPRRKKA